MTQEAELVPEFHFVRRGMVTRTRADALGAGLVVTPHDTAAEADVGRPQLVLPRA